MEQLFHHVPFGNAHAILQTTQKKKSHHHYGPLNKCACIMYFVPYLFHSFFSQYMILSIFLINLLVQTWVIHTVLHTKVDQQGELSKSQELTFTVCKNKNVKTTTKLQPYGLCNSQKHISYLPQINT